MKIELDHVVIAVADFARSNEFYERVVGAQIVARGEGFAYRFGNAQLNVHGPSTSAQPLARVRVVPGNSDLCFRFGGSIEEARAHLERCGVEIEVGPVQRSGWGGSGTSLYFRDPDGTLLEFLVFPDARELRAVSLENEWVRLEPLRLHHLEALWKVADDPRVYEHLPVHFAAKDDVERFIRDSLKREDADSSLPFAIWSKAENRFVGSSALFDFCAQTRAAEIGWTWHTPAVWGTKINLAAKMLLLEHGFERLHLVRMYLKTDVNNGRSQRAIEKLGAQREGVRRKHMKRPDGTWRDSIFYSILDDEWPVVKRELQQKLE